MKRIYVEKKEGYNLEALDILNEVRTFLKIDSVTGVRVLYRYDTEGLSEDEFSQAVKTIYSQKSTEMVYDKDLKFDAKALAIESLPGQYDQRSDFAAQCTKLVAAREEVTVKCSRVFLFYGDISDTELKTIKAYLINPVENIESSLEMPQTLRAAYQEIDTVETVRGFCGMSEKELAETARKSGVSMSLEDLLFCQEYFKKEKKDPTITELRIFDTYWSDHCRHSTFMTVIDSVEVEESPYKQAIENAAAQYDLAKQEIGSKAPSCLMDIAVMGMKKMRHNGVLADMEVSQEVNACSICVDVTVDGEPQEWLFMFKNETHNHPTEIEPFGGASTCLGGGIRDPLSGRAYVHGAIRLTGCGDPRTAYSDTLAGKLSQRKLTKTAAEGYSSYSNQIGLASGHLSEIYDPGFVAKRMECGALVAGVKKSEVIRMSPQKGDVVVLLGGNTGRDGCGGATGSSKEHDESSLATGGAEVQKGNPAIERNIVRLFRDPKAAKMIKKCNDFGAGGVSVAVCEMADSLTIELDKVPLKYGGMDGTEIAISESQERMACMLAPEDLDAFAAMADQENLQCVKIAEVTDDGRMIMWWKGNKIVDLSAEMLSSGGVRKHINVKVKAPKASELSLMAAAADDPAKSLTEKWLANLSDLNVCSKAGIASRFDTTASKNTVFMPFGGQYQKTPEQGLCMKFPARLGKCSTATLMTLGYNPKLGYFSPFHQAMYAVLESVLKICAMGGDPQKIRLTFQEYYEKLGNDAQRWGKPYAALMGAFLAQNELSIPSIGGKDSMSGTFMDIDVPPSLISFAVGTADTARVVSSAFKKPGSRVIKVYANLKEDMAPDWNEMRLNLEAVHKLCQAGSVRAASAVGFGGLAAAVSTMCFGNGMGFVFHRLFSDQDLFTPDYTALLLEVDDSADLAGLNYISVGMTTASAYIAYQEEKILLKDAVAAWESTLEEVFPAAGLSDKLTAKDAGTQPGRQAGIPRADYSGPAGEGQKAQAKPAPGHRRAARPKVLIPVFPGSNGEYELEDGFSKAGAEVRVMVFRNRTLAQQEQSIEELAQAIAGADILALPSGMSAGCEPCGSAKLIGAILDREPVKKALKELNEGRRGLILGVGEGFAALLRTGLLPYGRYRDEEASARRAQGGQEPATVAIEKNSVNQYVCQMVNVRIASILSPWLHASGSQAAQAGTQGLGVGRTVKLPLSIQEGRIVMDQDTFSTLAERGQIAAQYVDEAGWPAMEHTYNPCGSSFAVESMSSPDGRIFGTICSFDRLDMDLYQNIPGKEPYDLFQNAIQYFKQAKPAEVAVIMGSDSDWKTVKPAVDILDQFGVSCEVRIMSAHRTPDQVSEYVKGLQKRGVKAVIAAAGKAAHLAGVAAAYTALPVIGLPIAGSTLDGMDALLSMVQMPPGIPVAAVAVGGAENAALLAVAVLGAGDEQIYARLLAYRRAMADKVAAKDAALQAAR